MNPLGLLGNAVLFDLDPALIGRRRDPLRAGLRAGHDQPGQHRSTFFDYANQMKVAQREAQNEQRDFAQQHRGRRIRPSSTS